jgi:hypothetical protein
MDKTIGVRSEARHSDASRKKAYRSGENGNTTHRRRPSRSASSRAIKSAPHAAEQANASARSATSMSTSRCQTIGTFSSGKRGGSGSGASICRSVSAITAGGLGSHPSLLLLRRTLRGDRGTKPGREGSVSFRDKIRRGQASDYNKLYQATEIRSRSAATRFT